MTCTASRFLENTSFWTTYIRENGFLEVFLFLFEVALLQKPLIRSFNLFR